MRCSGSRLAAIFAAFVLSACAVGIQPSNSPEPFRGSFPQAVGYDAAYDAGYGDPGYGGEPPYAGEPYPYEERGYAAPQDYRWYSGREFRESERRYRDEEYREHRERAPSHEYRERREVRPSHGEYGRSFKNEGFEVEGYAHEKGRAEHKSGHALRYTYKYKLYDRVIKLDRPHLKRVKEVGYAARPAAHAYSYAEIRYEKPKKVVRKKVVRKKQPAKKCTCTEDKRVEDVRTRMKDSGVTVERFGKGYKMELPSDILFALNSDQVKPEAYALIRDVAEGLRSEEGAGIDVNGYADTSGTEEHNDLLSQSRAVAVADALAQEGVDPGLINPRGFGESVLRVPTPDGVREPRNRRVEILVVPTEG